MCYAQGRDIRMFERMRYAVSQPAPRFWISESRAKDIIGEVKRGRWNGKKKSRSERLARCLYERYLAIRKQRPKESVMSIMMEVVNSPAPESFISPLSAVVILCRYKTKIRKGLRLDVSPSRQPRKLIPAVIKPKDENEELLSDTCNNLDNHTGDNTAPVRVDVGAVSDKPADDVDGETDIQLSSRRVAALVCQPVLPADVLFPHARKSVAVLDSLGNRVDYASRIDRRHTNIRYIRTQLRIEWDADGPKPQMALAAHA